MTVRRTNSQNTPPVKEGYLCVGVIHNVHGLKGEVVIKAFTDNPLDMTAYGDVITEKDVSVVLKKLRVSNRGVLAFVEGVKYRDEAEALKGTYLYVLEEALPELEDDNAYMYQLEGMAIEREDGSVIGSVASVFDNGAHAVMELDVEGRDEPVLIPFTEDMILGVDVESNRLTVSEMMDDFLNL